MSEHNVSIEHLKQIAAKHHDKIIDMSIGSPKFPTDRAARQAGAEASQNDYPMTRGSELLREAGARWLAATYPSLEMNLDTDTVAATHGSKGAVGMIPTVMQHVRRRNGEAVRTTGLVPEIGYPTYFEAADYTNTPVVRYPLTDEGIIDLDALFRMRLDEKALSYMIINSPHNPTGGTMTSEQYAEVAAYASRMGVWLFSDESYQSHIWTSDPKKQGQTMLQHAHHGKVGSIFSPSKTYSAAGLRTGLIAGDREVVEAMWDGGKRLGAIASAASQRAYTDLLDRHDEVAEPLTEQYRTKLETILRCMTAAAQVGIEFEKLEMPEGGLYVWTKSADPHADGSDLAVSLAVLFGLVVSPGHTFGDDERTKDHIRIAAVADDEHMRLLEKRTAA